MGGAVELGRFTWGESRSAGARQQGAEVASGKAGQEDVWKSSAVIVACGDRHALVLTVVRQKDECKVCGGSGFCEHQRERSRCKVFRQVKGTSAEMEKGKTG